MSHQRHKGEAPRPPKNGSSAGQRPVIMEQVEQRLQMAADLAVYNINVNGSTAPITVDRGQQYTVNFSLLNQGNVPAWYNNSGVVISTDSYISKSDRLVARTSNWYLGSYNAEYKSASFTVPSDYAPGQRLYVGVIADYDGYVPENSESNNTTATPVTMNVRMPRTAAPGTAGVYNGYPYVVYANEVRYGGTRAWRNNNPGNIVYGDFARSQGAIGTDGRMAIFPDEATGMQAIVALFRTASYRDLTLKDAIYRYAPPFENNTDAYVSIIRQRTGLDPYRRVSSLTSSELLNLAQVIKQVEGWTPGTTYYSWDSGAPQWAKQLLGS